jgi:hypothetical protein
VIGLGLGVVTFGLLLPPLQAARYSALSGRDRLRIGRRSWRNYEAFPGLDRILNSIHEGLVHEWLRIMTLLAAALMIAFSLVFGPAPPMHSLMLIIAFMLSTVAFGHSILMERFAPDHSESLPFLSLHAPATHNTIIDSTLSDLLYAHLDPETAGYWSEWTKRLEQQLAPAEPLLASRERLLYLIHLQQEGLMGYARFRSELNEFMHKEGVEDFLYSDPHLNLDGLAHLIRHTRAWQPGMFRIIDRLQFALLDQGSSVESGQWRMDVDLPKCCAEGQGDLFVMVNNLCATEDEVVIEVRTTDGEPQFQEFKLKLEKCAPPKLPLPLLAEEQDDVVDWMSKMLDCGRVLWLGLAWNIDVNGARPVQVTMRRPNGPVLDSITMWTEVQRKGSKGYTTKSRLEKARKVARQRSRQSTA